MVLRGTWCDAEEILINILPKEGFSKRPVQTGPDRSLIGPGIFEMAKDHGPDCGCGPVWSCDFRF